MLKKALNLLLAFTLLTTTWASAQTYMSPFSRFGVGDILPASMVRNRAMGGASIASMQKDIYSLSNPASYSMMTSFSLETGVTAAFYDLKTNTQNLHSSDYRIPYLSLAVPLDTMRKFGFSAGLLPYSKEGLISQVNSHDTINSLHRFFSNGQLSKFYLGASFQVFHNFFLGANAGYIFGNTRAIDSLMFPDSANLYPMTHTTTTYIGDFTFDAGAIYRIDLKHDYHIQLGLMANLPSAMNTRQYMDLISYYYGSGGQRILSDSLYSNQVTEGKTYLSMNLGGGINISRSDSWQIAADVSYRKWSDFYSMDVMKGTYQNALSFSLGGEWVPGADISSGRFKRYMGSVRYRLGFHYAQEYFTINGQTPTDKRITLGAGFPIRVNKTFFSYLDVAVELGEIGNVSQVGTQQRYAMLSLGMHMFEPNWFKKYKIE